MAREVRPTVAAIIVTFKRPEVVLETLAGILSQSTAPDSVVVVDNDSDDAVRESIAALLPQVLYVGSPENAGYGAALALGMQAAQDTYDPDWYWLLDDDTPPHRDHLQIALRKRHDKPVPWFISGRGGTIGVKVKHANASTLGARDPHFALVDGALVSRTAVDCVGFPRTDLFMMFEDVEYTYRIRQAGGRVVLAPGIVDQSRHMGTSSSWRKYYLARNHLRCAIDLRSPRLFIAWLYRMSAQSLYDLRNAEFSNLLLRWRGALDGLRGHMGVTLPPK